jgi:hypothetical protein
MHAPPDPEMRRGGPPQATPVVRTESPKHYHFSPDVQAVIALLAPLCVVLLLAIGGRP